MVNQQVQFDHSFLGKRFLGNSYKITVEHLREFCAVVGETNPIYLGTSKATIVPPIFLALLRRHEKRPEIDLHFMHIRRLPGGESAEIFEDVHVGDTISAAGFLREIYSKKGRSGTMVFVVWETEFQNQHGRRVASFRDSQVFIQ